MSGLTRLSSPHYKTSDKNMKNCGFWTGHDWEKWYVIQDTEILGSATKAVKGRFIIQMRECKACGFKEYATRKIDVNEIF